MKRPQLRSIIVTSAVVLLAGVYGGPRPLSAAPETRGGDDCNTYGLKSANCQPVRVGVTCRSTFQKCKTPAVGTLMYALCQPGQGNVAACNSDDKCAQTNDDDLTYLCAWKTKQRKAAAE